MQNSYERFGWKENPFTLRIDPFFFTGYEEQIRALQKHIGDKHKVALITGATGSGKTTMLKWLEKELSVHRLYIAKPPEKSEDFTEIFSETFGIGFFKRLFGFKLSLFNLPKYLNKRLKGSQLVILLDEAHETNTDVMEWLRVLIDQIENVSLIMAGMPVLESKIKGELETLDQRITSRIYLTSLSESETKDLIRRRIEHAGGLETKPFTDEAISAIYKRTGGFPREIVKMCDKMISKALESESSIIDVSFIEEFRELEGPSVSGAGIAAEPVVTFMPKPPSEATINALSFKQKKILEIMSKDDWMTPGNIFEKIETHSYKSRGHAIRSLNNILHRLMLDGFVQREARGKSFLYALSPKTKTMFVEK